AKGNGGRPRRDARVGAGVRACDLERRRGGRRRRGGGGGGRGQNENPRREPPKGCPAHPPRNAPGKGTERGALLGVRRTMVAPQLERSFRAPGVAPVWTDISSKVLEIQIPGGRQYDLDTIQAGTCTLTLDTPDRRFDPTYTAGLYYPNVLPMVGIRVSGT